MSRRIEVTVPTEWADPVRECLRDKDRCNLIDSTEKPHMLVELTGRVNTVFLITVPGPQVSPTLEHLRKSGIGVSIGRVVITSLDFLKPELSRPLNKIVVIGEDGDIKEAADDEDAAKKKKAKALKGFQHFQKARKTTEELYNDISNGANMNMNTWLNLIGASVIAAGGLTLGSTVYIVAAMLVSPIMGPILGMTFGYRIADWPLFKAGFISEMKMALTSFLIGLFIGVILGPFGKTYNWPNAAMSASSSHGFNLIVSGIVSAAAGIVLGVSLTSTGGNALVGTAISAGLLPPIVNAGMLISFSLIYAPLDQRAALYEMGNYQILYYFTHVVVIIIVANFVFWLKDIDPRFREGEDSRFDDIPSLANHKKKLLADLEAKRRAEGGGGGGAGGVGAGLKEKFAFEDEKARAKYFFDNVKEDVLDGFKKIDFLGVLGPKPGDPTVSTRLKNEAERKKKDESFNQEDDKDIELALVARIKQQQQQIDQQRNETPLDINIRTSGAAAESGLDSEGYSVVHAGDEEGQDYSDSVVNPVHRRQQQQQQQQSQQQQQQQQRSL